MITGNEAITASAIARHMQGQAELRPGQRPDQQPAVDGVVSARRRVPITSCCSRAWSCCQTTTFRRLGCSGADRASGAVRCRRPARSIRSRTSRA